jgi:DNA invertase Pin-like site-specific DNA recombinase
MSPKKITRPLDVYVRVSRVGGREGDSFISPELQAEKCLALAKSRGLTVGETFTDLDQSGGKMARPAFDQALERIESGESGGIIVARIDRFARTLVGGLQAIEAIEAAGGVVLTADGEFDTSTATGELVLRIMLSLAAFELRRIKEGWKASVGNAIDRGVFIGPKVPVGYVKNERGQLELDPDKAEIIAELFRLRGTGASWGALRSFMDERLPREDGGSWPAGTVNGIIRARYYLGESSQGAVVNKDAHQPIVSRLEWEMAQSTKGRAASDSTGALLAGVVRCASCGFAMSRQSAGAKKNSGRYRCFKHHSSGECPSPTSISATALDRYVIDGMQAELNKLPRKQVDTSKRDESFAEATATLEAAETEMAVYLDSVSAALVGAGAFAAGAASRREAIEKAQSDLAAVQTAVTLPDDPAEAWRVMDDGDRRKFLLTTSAVFVKPAPFRGRGTQIAERVKFLSLADFPGLADTLPGRKNKEMRPFDWLGTIRR